MGSDLSIVRAARVSHNADWRAGEDEDKDTKLINYLITHGHNTPVESVEFQFEIRAPIFVIRQWHRHRTHTYNEISARYTELDEGFYLPNISVVGKGTPKNKQARDVNAPLTREEYQIRVQFLDEVLEHQKHTHALYQKWLSWGIPREIARIELPLSAYSRYFDKVDLHNLFGFIHERISDDAQYEIRNYAYALLKLIRPIVPIATEAFCKSILKWPDSSPIDQGE